MSISPARNSAFDVLWRIERDSAFSSPLLESHENSLQKRDRALCHSIVLGTLRRRLYLDELIKAVSDREIESIDPPVLQILRLGLFQLRFLDRVPPSAVVNDAVELVKKARKRSAAPFVNAVLRKASRESFEPRFDEDLLRISVLESHPLWLVERWERRYGLADTEAIAAANNMPQKLFFRFTACFYALPAKSRSEIERELAQSGEVSRFELATDAFVAERRSERLSALARDALIYFQDASSQVAAGAVRIPDGGRLLDVAAAPGGKLTLVGSRHLGGSNRFFGGDISFRKAVRLRTECLRQGLSDVAIAVYDGTLGMPFGEERFERVLLDAPCSGTGTLGVNPELRYRLDEGEFDSHRRKQLKMLRSASKMVKRGGELLYATCSLEPEENEGVIRGFLDTSELFEPVIPDVNPDLVNSEGFVRMLPHKHGTNGFFLACMRRLGG